MGKEIRTEIESLRAADADRQKVADQLKDALEEGRLSLHEYDERVGLAYAAKTYQELLVIVSDLPKPGLSSAEVRARRQQEERRAARRLPTAMVVLWIIWGSLAAVNLMVYGLVAFTTSGPVYPWPVWLLVPGVALGVVTVGVQAIRLQNLARRSR
ncbi:DUF1707 SHOCT-like domain-containing protein [Paractinoplanes rishiriensis]|uniref:DUF1707 domain-containing protein n=1 Tax=Paractinoplanes rishiriensis TaxID=1050105 RepID=A0A919N171_9ACTN|nr:DUF1707 domain-containing protein [Actinoplanes rishiriensis]GIE96157.1 hypothetical protein Ari01nite_36220 [Actinoplanes rishiriensis]